jgi:HAD superfamily hydrolase (TIGR01459 family)
MTLIPGLAELADRYDGYIIDLWGVIHDGVTPYAGAIDCLSALRRHGKRIVLLSNAPRRAAVAIEGLTHLGIPAACYDAVVTSGEAAFLALRDRPEPWHRALGARPYHLGPPRDASVLDGLDLLTTTHPAQASFVLNTGPDDERNPTDPAAYDDVLHACHAASLPMLCANPDLTVVRGGVDIVCAGTLAERYVAMGGESHSIGKPDPAIYQGVLATLGTPRNRVLAIGDSLRTDIAGAANAGVDALWILGGIHAHTEPAAGQRQASAMNLSPAGMMHRLVW